MAKENSNLLLKTQNTIISAALIISSAYGISALLGFFRSRLLGSYFGDSTELAVFYIADRIPNLIYSLIVVGTLSTVFIPVFTDLLKRNKTDAWNTASVMLTLSISAFMILSIGCFIASPYIIELLSLGKLTPDQIELGSNLMRIMLTAQFVLIISSFITSILHSFKCFIVPAVAPILYNLGMILGIILFTDRFGIYGPAFGVIIGSILHLIVQLPSIVNTGFPFKVTFDFKNKGLHEILSLLPPRIFGSAIIQISSTVSNSLAILVSTSAVTHLRYAEQLQTFPVNLIGASIASAALPSLCYETDLQDLSKFKKTFLTTFFQIMFLAVPASVILLILRLPVVRLVFGTRNFPWDATLMIAQTLGYFSLSIFAQSAVYLLTRAFYSFKDTKTPVKVSFLTIILNVALSYLFVRVFGLGVWAIALAYSISSIADLIILLILLSTKVGGFNIGELLSPFAKISASAILMGIALYIPLKSLDIKILDTTRTGNLIVLTLIVLVCGGSVYLILTKILRVKEVELLYKLLGKLNLSKKVTSQEALTTDNIEL